MLSAESRSSSSSITLLVYKELVMFILLSTLYLSKIFFFNISVICMDHRCLLPGVWGINSILFYSYFACHVKTMNGNISFFSPACVIGQRVFRNYLFSYFYYKIHDKKNKKRRSLFRLTRLKTHIRSWRERFGGFVSAGSCVSWS